MKVQVECNNSPRNKKEALPSQWVRNATGWELLEWCAILTTRAAGGILVAWNPLEVGKVDEIVGNFSISICLVDISSGFDWLIIGIYGPSTLQNQSDFWEELYCIRRWPGPWIVGGAFIVIKKIVLTILQ